MRASKNIRTDVTERGAALAEASVFMLFMSVLMFGAFDLLQVAKVAIKAQQVVEMTAKVGSVKVPKDGSTTSTLPSDAQLFIVSGPYLPEWRTSVSSPAAPAMFDQREIRALNLGLGYSKVVFPNYNTVANFDAASWTAGTKIADREIALLPMHYTDAAYTTSTTGPSYVTYRVCVGTKLVLAGLVNVCRNATMPAF